MNKLLRLSLLSVLIILLIDKPRWTEAEPQDIEESWESTEEESCPKGHFWHIRGQYCVPERCPRGNSYRNRKTGNCLYSKASLKRSQPDSVEKIGTNGWALGSQGFYQPRGMSIMPFNPRLNKMYNGKRSRQNGWEMTRRSPTMRRG